MWEASWAPVVKVLPRVLARNTAAAGTPDAGHGWSGPGKRGWATRQGLDLGGDVTALGVQGDELAGQVGQDDASGVGPRDGDGLPGQGIDNRLRPEGVALGAVGLELGVDLGRPRLA